MSTAPGACPAPTTYRNQVPYPFCPGCGHAPILDQLDAALVSLRLEPRQVVLVTDIGCSGLSDQYFGTSAFHGLHGRSVTYATGIKLARPDLKVVVIMGDGGTGIGGAHLINAARRNIGITVLVCNNFNFGMTGGQHSTTTPLGAATATTPGGNLERPLDICATVAANGAGYVHRGTSFDKDLSERLAEAIDSECFALLDVWELCTAYYVPSNDASRRTLTEMHAKLGLQSGVLQRASHPEFAAACRGLIETQRGRPSTRPRPITARFTAALQRPFRLVIAGSAGGKVRSAARLLAEAAMLSGLWVAQRDDYPITVKTGHSIAELVFSPEEIDYTGVTRPDALLVLTGDGLSKSGRHLAAMEAADHVFAPPALGALRTRATQRVVDPAQAPVRIGAGRLALYTATVALRELDLFPLAALEAAAETGSAEHARENLETIRAALGRPRGGA